MMDREKKKGKAEGEEVVGGETGMGRWLLTYADMITLLMMLFTVLYASSVLNQKKFEELARSLGIGFRGGQSAIEMWQTSLLPSIRLGAQEGENPQAAAATSARRLTGIYQKARSMFQPEIGKRRIRVVTEERGIVVQIGADFFFASGSAALSNEALRVLFSVSTLLQEIPNRVQIEGHTDNTPIEEGSELSVRFPSNWELSAQRAINVLKYLTSLGIASDRLAATAYGDTNPMVANDTPEGRAYNRRVEIVILP